MTTNNHPAHGPVSLERLHQIHQYIERNNQYQNGGNRAYILADVLKVIDEVLERRKDDDKNLVKERQRVIDGLCTIGETAWEIEEYMKKWDAEHVAMKSFGNSEQLIKHQSSNQDSDSNASSDEIKQPASNESVALIKPVSDLYSITSPTGSETTFTFDAGEASSFVGSGWSVQEYVELERYQEAITGK